MKKIGVVGIVITGDKSISGEVQNVLSSFSDIIIGRMGIPRKEANTIAVVVEGSIEKVSALTGKLGRLKDVTVKSALTSVEVE